MGLDVRHGDEKAEAASQSPARGQQVTQERSGVHLALWVSKGRAEGLRLRPLRTGSQGALHSCNSKLCQRASLV